METVLAIAVTILIAAAIIGATLFVVVLLIEWFMKAMGW